MSLRTPCKGFDEKPSVLLALVSIFDNTTKRIGAISLKSCTRRRRYMFENKHKKHGYFDSLPVDRDFHSCPQQILYFSQD